MIRALYGGSFDPVHAGHLAVIDRLRDDGLADVVHVVPAYRSPFKQTSCRASSEDRLDLLRAAIADRADVVVDAREITRDRLTYTVETLGELAGEFPDDRWRLIIGGDHARAFRRWREPERLLELADVVVVARGGVPLFPPLAGRALVVADFDHPAESTAIRWQLAAGQRPPASMLPPAVTALIVSRKLYDWPGEE